MRTTLKDRKKQYRIIFELLWEEPRIPVKEIAAAVGPYVVKRRSKEAFEDQYIIGPDIRKRSYSNLREYMYFVNCENPELAYLEYQKNEKVIYHAQMKGFCNFWIIAKEKIDVEGDIILEGPRSDYYTSYAPHHSQEKALENMRKKIEEFDPGDYVPKKYIKTHFGESVEWDKEDELLCIYFKDNLRKPFAPVMRKHTISGGKLYKFLENLPETCTIAASYYPDTLLAYDHYLHMFETDYEDFLIDLFSELPTSSSFFKVSNNLFARIYVHRRYIKDRNFQMAMKKWYIPILMIDLLEKGIVKNKESALLEYHWTKNL